MKKLLVAVLAVLMAMSLIACAPAADEPADADADAGTDSGADASADQDTPNDAQQPAEDDAEDVADADEPLKVGYVCNFMSHEWYQNVTGGAQRRAEDKGVILEVADANLDSAQQISYAENFIAKGVDVLALTPVDATTLGPIIEAANKAGILVVTESNPVGGEATCVGADNKEAGRLSGKWMGDYAVENGIDLKILVVGFPNFEDCRLRVEGFKEGLEESGANFVISQEVDSQGGKELSLTASTDALTAHPEINAIFGINDDSTQGAIQAYKGAGLDESKLVAVGYGLEGIVGREALLNDTPVKAELAMFPDFVGASLIDACIKAKAGEELPERFLTPTVMVTSDTYADFYTQEGDQWIMNFDAVEAEK